MDGKKWFLLGITFLGLLIGLMVGLSTSPIVETVVTLVFAFTGGSVIVLIKGKNDYELNLIGKSIMTLSLFITIGIAAGIVFRANDIANYKKPAPFKISKNLSVQDIITLTKHNIAPIVIMELLKSSHGDNKNNKLEIEEIIKLKKNNVSSIIILSMLGNQEFINGNRYYLTLDDIVKLTKNKVNPKVISIMLGKVSSSNSNNMGTKTNLHKNDLKNITQDNTKYEDVQKLYSR